MKIFVLIVTILYRLFSSVCHSVWVVLVVWVVFVCDLFRLFQLSKLRHKISLQSQLKRCL